MAERYRFWRRAQNENESIIQYVPALKKLVVTCNFGQLTDEMVRDKLIGKRNVPCIGERAGFINYMASSVCLDTTVVLCFPCAIFC